jgi:Flp pilus assembly protein TadB
LRYILFFAFPLLLSKDLLVAQYSESLNLKPDLPRKLALESCTSARRSAFRVEQQASKSRAGMTNHVAFLLIYFCSDCTYMVDCVVWVLILMKFLTLAGKCLCPVNVYDVDVI